MAEKGAVPLGSSQSPALRLTHLLFSALHHIKSGHRYGYKIPFTDLPANDNNTSDARRIRVRPWALLEVPSTELLRVISFSKSCCVDVWRRVSLVLSAAGVQLGDRLEEGSDLLQRNPPRTLTHAKIIHSDTCLPVRLSVNRRDEWVSEQQQPHQSISYSNKKKEENENDAKKI